jgi:CRISPR-associated protein Cas5t
MEALRLNIKQLSACYRMPTTTGVWLSYPLPPYATIYGFLRAICRQTKETEESINYKNTRLSVKGIYTSSYFDLQIMHREDLKDKVGKTEPYKVQVLYNITLEIHIISDSKRLHIIEHALNDPPFTLSLGRREDLITELTYKRTEIKEIEPDLDILNIESEYPFYLPQIQADKYGWEGILFNLPQDCYFLRQYNLRRMHYQKVYYITPDALLGIGEEKIFTDKDGRLVWI